MEAAIIILAVFSVPLTGIVSWTWLRAKKLDAGEGNRQIQERMRLLDKENTDLRRRVEVLESIAIDSRELSREDVRRRGLEASRRLDDLGDSDEASARAVVNQSAEVQR